MDAGQQNRLWDAINRYAAACGGDPSQHVYGNTMRQKAVADVGAVIREAEILQRLPPLPQLPVLSEGWDGQPELLAKMLAPKPSESSMVQRIEALEKLLRRCAGVLGAHARGMRLDGALESMLRADISAAVDGPPDPERDRETKAETERP